MTLHFRELSTLQRSSQKSLSGIWLAQAVSAAGQNCCSQTCDTDVAAVSKPPFGSGFSQEPEQYLLFTCSANLDRQYCLLLLFATAKATGIKKYVDLTSDFKSLARRALTEPEYIFTSPLMLCSKLLWSLSLQHLCSA